MNTTTMRMARPTYRPTAVVQDGIVAILIFIVTELMFFSGLISAFLVVKAGVAWPPPDQPRLPVAATAFNSFVLLASGVSLWWANRAFAEWRDAVNAQKRLILTIGLGGFFVVFQGYEWVRLLEFGLTMQSSTYGAFFYLIVGAHALHALAALMALGYCCAQLTQGELTRTTFSTVQIFWYFVVLLWPVLYTLVYLL